MYFQYDMNKAVYRILATRIQSTIFGIHTVNSPPPPTPTPHQVTYLINTEIAVFVVVAFSYIYLQRFSYKLVKIYDVKFVGILCHGKKKKH